VSLFELVEVISSVANIFSPFVQRVWIALEAKGLQYQYIEVDPYKKPRSLLEVNPRGLVPAIRHGDWGCGESNVLMEYVCTLSIFLQYLETNYSCSWRILVLVILSYHKAIPSSGRLVDFGVIT
jgi:glutathione S-transferase